VRIWQTKLVSREAAAERSPRREPWVLSAKNELSPEGAKEPSGRPLPPIHRLPQGLNFLSQVVRIF